MKVKKLKINKIKEETYITNKQYKFIIIQLQEISGLKFDNFTNYIFVVYYFFEFLFSVCIYLEKVVRNVFTIFSLLVYLKKRESILLNNLTFLII